MYMYTYICTYIIMLAYMYLHVYVLHNRHIIHTSCTVALHIYDNALLCVLFVSE